MNCFYSIAFVIIVYIFFLYSMYIQKLTGRTIEGPELIGNVPLIHHLYELINLKINIELNFV